MWKYEARLVNIILNITKFFYGSLDKRATGETTVVRK
jgi:hypothetical protein